LYKQIDIFSDLIALQLGVVHPTIACAGREERPKSIDEALASMTASESRTCRRKFRKLLRQRNVPDETRRRWTRKRCRSEVMLSLRARAWDVMSQSSGSQLSDNDE
jgi:siroheme synthase (precorrin-2 oxidase/ferrochelatase)